MIELNARLGDSIDDIYKEAIVIASKANDVVHFEGNGIDFYADKDSNPCLVNEYLNDCYRYDIKTLGPRDPKWTEDFISQKEKEYQLQETERRKQWEYDKQIENEDYQTFLDFVGNEEIEVNDPSQLEKFRNANSDHFYGQIYVAFLEDIAKYLQVVKRINGYITKDDVKKGEKLIRKHGITGFQRACIVNVLKQIWKHWQDDLFI